MKANNKIPVITAAVVILVVFLAYLWISGLLIPKGITNYERSSINSISTFKDINNSPSRLPPDILDNISSLQDLYHISINKWEFDPVNQNQIIVFAYDIRNDSAIKEISGKEIGNFSIRLIRDIEFENTRAEVEQELSGLKKDPAYHISWIGMVTDTSLDPIGRRAEVWVDMSTPENQKLDKTVIKGWKIFVYPMAPLPKGTRNASSPLPQK